VRDANVLGGADGMNIANLITLARILMVPIAVWSLITGQYVLAFTIFIAAGVSDGVDGFLARRLQIKTELGAYLDPLADKALLVSIYMVLAILELIPVWLAIAVATRDILIVAAVILSRLLEKPVEMKPLMISKANTVAQIAFAGLILGLLALGQRHEILTMMGAIVVAGFTFASGAIYMRDWMIHMTTSAGENE
jgi:cardiolipin synthase (CMP-forming)